jgi:hypothetical protein
VATTSVHGWERVHDIPERYAETAEEISRELDAAVRELLAAPVPLRG